MKKHATKYDDGVGKLKTNRKKIQKIILLSFISKPKKLIALKIVAIFG